MTTTPTEWRGPTTANTGNTTGTQFDQRVVALSNGNFMVIWVDNTNNVDAEDGSDIIGQVFNPLGETVGSPFHVNESAYFYDNESDISVAALPGGGVVIVFIDENDINEAGTPNENAVRFLKLDNSGSFVAGGTIAIDAADDLRNPEVAVFDDGSFVVSFTRDDGGDEDIRGVIVSSTNVVGTEFGISNQTDVEVNGRIAVLSNGNYVMAFDDNTDGEIEFYIRTPGGVQVDQGFLPGGVGADSEPDVAALAGGGFVVVWTEDGNVVMEIFANSGAQRLATTNVAATGDSENEPVVVALQDGGFVVLWDNDTDSELVGQRYDADGVAIGVNFVVASAPTGIEATLLGDGRVLVSYWAADGAGEPTFAIWDPRENTINGDPTNNVLTGRQEASTIVGGGGDDTLYGVDGDDLIQGNAGEDTIYGGDGNDHLEGGGDDDVLLGEEGTDLIRGGGGDDIILGGNGGDTLRGLAGDDIIVGENGLDRIEGAAGDDTLVGGEGGDTIIGGDGVDTLVGDDGQDTINGSAGDDTITGNAGNDVLSGNAGIDTITGGTEDDTIFGGGQDDLLSGDAGNDEVRGGAGNDEMYGADGDDQLFGITGNDSMFGDAGNDELFGGGGADELSGGADDDILRGADGDDTLIGNAGVDVLVGGADADTFTFLTIGDSGTALGSRDQINDFSRAEGDTIDLSAIDADTITGGDQAFQVVGNFTGIAGQLTITAIGGGGVLVALDVDGDSSADMAFEVFGQADLGAGDFVL